jgi:hypothetical protein
MTVSSVLEEIFFSEDGGSRFLQNVNNDLPDYMLSHPRRHHLPVSFISYNIIFTTAKTLNSQVWKFPFSSLITKAMC